MASDYQPPFLRPFRKIPGPNYFEKLSQEDQLVPTIDTKRDPMPPFKPIPAGGQTCLSGNDKETAPRSSYVHDAYVNYSMQQLYTIVNVKCKC